MPRGDGTGPMGQGPMTGRAMGWCAGTNAPGYANPGFGGRGAGRGFGGGGRGRRNMVRMTGLTGWQRAGMGWPAGAPAYAPEPVDRRTEVEDLKAQAEQMGQALESIRARIDELTADES